MGRVEIINISWTNDKILGFRKVVKSREMVVYYNVYQGAVPKLRNALGGMGVWPKRYAALRSF